MLGREEGKSLASLSESAESASQTTASVGSRTCLKSFKDLLWKVDERNQSPAQFIWSLTCGWDDFSGMFNNGWGFFNRRDFMLDGEEWEIFLVGEW